MNKKKLLVSLSMVGMLTLGSVFGTMARYKYDAQSTTNTIQAAIYNVSSNLSDSRKITIDNAYPGMPEQYHSFVVNKGATEVPIKYTIAVSKTGAIFTTENSPVVAVLQKYNETTLAWEDVVGGSTITVDEATGAEILNNHNYKYRVRVAWPLDTANFDDKTLSNATGSISIALHSEQTDMSAVSTYHNFVNVKTYIKHKPTGHYYLNQDGKSVVEYYKEADGRRVMVLHDVAVTDNNVPTVLSTVTFVETAVGSKNYKVDGLAATYQQTITENSVKWLAPAGGQYEFHDMPQILVDWLQ